MPTAITKNASGHYQVNDPAMRSEILKLRNDPTANAVMAGAFTKANAALLSDQLGRSPSEGELYIAHFLGAGGAARLIIAAASQSECQRLRAIFPMPRTPILRSSTIARPAPPRSLAQVRDVLTARYELRRAACRTAATSVAQAAIAPGREFAAAADTAAANAVGPSVLPQSRDRPLPSPPQCPTPPA